MPKHHDKTHSTAAAPELLHSTGQARNDNALLPSFIRAYFLELTETPQGSFFRPLVTFPVDFPIQLNSPDNWFMHQDGQLIDIAAVRLKDDIQPYILPINHEVGALASG